MSQSDVVDYGSSEKSKPKMETCRHGVTDNGKSTMGLIFDAAAMAVAAINTAAAVKMADLQYDIAKQYLDIAKWWRNYYNNTYKPWEDQELSEAWAQEKIDPMYDITIGRTRTYGRLQFRGVIDQSLRCTSAYCTGLREAMLKDIATAEATTIAAMANMGYRNERAYVEARNNTRWERRTQVLNRGRDMLANNVQFSSMAAGIFGDLGQQAGAGAAGAMRYLGYSWTRNETQFPTVMRGQVTRESRPSVQEATPVKIETNPVSTPSYNTGPMSGGWTRSPDGGYTRGSGN